MCCCGLCILLDLLKKGPCPGKGCTCWFILSMLFSLIVFGVMLAFEVYLDTGGGRFPIPDYETFSGLLYTGNIVSFIACIGCLVIIFLNKEKLIFAIPCEVALVFGFCVTLYCIYYVSDETAGARMSTYTREYYREEKKAPPFMTYVQNKARVEIPTPGNSEYLGCCGGKSFDDYAISTFSKPNNVTLFDAPDSCCKMKIDGCGKDLIYSYHYAELGFINAAIKKVADGGIKKNLTAGILEIMEQYMNDLKKAEEVASAERNKTKPGQRLSLPAAAGTPDLDNILTPEQIERLKNSLDTVNRLQEQHAILKDFKENLIKYVKISVIGCGRIFDALCSECLIGFISVKAVVDLLTIVVFTCYYTRMAYCKLVPLI